MYWMKKFIRLGLIALLPIIALVILLIGQDVAFWKRFGLYFGLSLLGAPLIFGVYKKSRLNHDHAKLMTFAWVMCSFVIAVIFSCAFEYHRFKVIEPAIQIVLALVFTYFHFAFGVQVLALSFSRLRRDWFRCLFSFPAALCFTSQLLTLVTSPLWVPLWFFLGKIVVLVVLGLYWLISLMGLIQTIFTRDGRDWDVVRIYLHENEPPLPNLVSIPLRQQNAITSGRRPIRVVQITDPHIGPVMSLKRLRNICESTVQHNPDIVLLTGDFLTVEAHSNIEDALQQGLQPLTKLRGRVFACLGNHDKEAQYIQLHVTAGLAKLGIPLLVDEQQVIETEIGAIQLIGLDYMSPLKSKDHIEKVTSNFLPNAEHTIARFVMLHDPGGFKYLPSVEKCLVFSGHTHGGQFGLLSLGLNLTAVRAIGMPDHGLWGCGKNRLYVHRGQGTRTLLGNMVTRLGVSPEYSVLEVHVD